MTEPWVAPMAVDAGSTTGVAWGKYPPAGLTPERLAAGWTKSREIKGDELAQAVKIAKAWESWDASARLDGMLPVLIVEDFVLTRFGSSARAGLSSVRIAAYLEALCWKMFGARGERPVYQQPSKAMRFATNERLRQWGIYVVGSEHERDARRHLAVYLADH